MQYDPTSLQAMSARAWGERFLVLSRISCRVGRIWAALRSRSSLSNFVYCHILVSRSGMPGGQDVVRLRDDCYLVGGGKETKEIEIKL